LQHQVSAKSHLGQITTIPIAISIFTIRIQSTIHTHTLTDQFQLITTIVQLHHTTTNHHTIVQLHHTTTNHHTIVQLHHTTTNHHTIVHTLANKGFQ
jgi:hypothetical protein